MALSSAIFERISPPCAREGSRTGALRFGNPHVTALAGALCAHVHTVSGFTNQRLRSLVAGLLGVDYTPNQIGYDLRRLRRQGLITRQPRHQHLTPSTPDGVRFAIFYTKVHDRILRPLLAADYPPAPTELKQAPCEPSTATSTATSPTADSLRRHKSDQTPKTRHNVMRAHP